MQGGGCPNGSDPLRRGLRGRCQRGGRGFFPATMLRLFAGLLQGSPLLLSFRTRNGAERRNPPADKKAPSLRELAAEQMRSSLKELLLFKSTFFSYSLRLPQKRQTPPSWREALRSPLTQGSRKNAQHFCGTFARGAKFRDSLALPRHSERQARRGSAFRTY